MTKTIPGHREAYEERAQRRFRSKYVVRTDGCWLWVGETSPNGYGKMYYRGRKEYAHRLSCIMFKDGIPEGMFVDHLCRMSLCVNPDHLEPVSPAINSQRGNTSVLTVEAVRHIRTELAEPIARLAEQYGAAPVTVFFAAIGKYWKNVV